jgi:hypothetical protein
MRAKLTTPACIVYTLRFFPHFATLRTSSTSAESIPLTAAGTLPVRLPIGLPSADGATDMYIVHSLDICRYSTKVSGLTNSLNYDIHQIRLAVLITFTPLNRVVAQPCDTALTCDGCPLPSKKEPPRR